MCKIINDLVENARKESFAEGMSKGRYESVVASIKSLKASQNWTTEQALTALNIDKKNWATYIALL